jgi:hypothetical protein
LAVTSLRSGRNRRAANDPGRPGRVGDIEGGRDNPASGAGNKPPPQSYSAFQLNTNHLKRFVAKILRKMIESRKIRDRSGLGSDVFYFPIRIREAHLTVRQKMLTLAG